MNKNLFQHDNFTVYTQSDHLLFQFILSEFLIAYPDIESIEGCIQQITESGVSDELWAHLFNSLTHLNGGLAQEDSSFPWVPNKGSMGKLKQCCSLYSISDAKLAGPCADVKSHVGRAYHSVAQAFELLSALSDPTDEARHVANVERLVKLLSRVGESMRKVSKLLTRLMRHYQRDENVLYFLLRHHHQLDQVYHPGFVKGLLETFFKGGLGEASTFLRSRYQGRGFDHVTREIDNELANL